MPPAAGAEARVALARDALVGADPAACAQAVLRWLGRHAGVDRAFCAVVDAKYTRLNGLIGDGVPHARVEEFSVELEYKDHPLVMALGGREPMFVRSDRQRWSPRTPLGAEALLVIPLTRPELQRGEPGLGVLVLAEMDLPAPPDVLWAADLLAVRLLCARYQHARDAEHRLRREHGMLHSVINSVTDPILLSDADGRMLVANAPAEKLLSADEHDSEGRRRAVALNNMLFSATVFTATEHGARARRELALVDPTEGQDLLFEVLSTAIPDERGNPGVVSVLRNVNDLRRASEEIEQHYQRLRVTEAEARAERDRLDLIINAVVDPVLVTDAQGNIELMNPPAERLFTATRDGTAPSSERHIRANDVMFSSFVSNLYTTGALRWRGELPLVDPSSGTSLPFEAMAGKVISKQGEVTAVVTILHDRREAIENAQLYEQVKRHTEELQRRVREATLELTQQNELLQRQALELEQASDAKSRFLANMSHELRTPLNAVLGYTELLLRGAFGELNAKQSTKLERVDSNARHLLSIINDLLDIARIESGQIRVLTERFSLRGLIEEVMAEVDPLVQRSRLAVTTDIDDGPELESDRQKLKQIIINLLSNALKFTPEGFVQVRAVHEGEQVQISVADTGIGIAPEQQQRVFEDFHQVDGSHVRLYGGTGLGLGICRRLARALGGQMTVVSKLGAGSTFTLQLPRRRRDA